MIVVLIFCYLLIKPNRLINNYIDTVSVDTFASLIVVGIILVLINLLASLLQKTNEAYLALGDNDGSIKLSNRAIEKTVINCLDRYEPIVEKIVNVKIKSKEGQEPRVDIMAKCGIDERSFIPITVERAENKEEVDSRVAEQGQIESDTSLESSVNRGQDLEWTDVYLGDSLDRVCRQVQEEAHKSLENLLGFRIGKLDMKFYHVKEKIDRTTRNKGQNKNDRSEEHTSELQ